MTSEALPSITYATPPKMESLKRTRNHLGDGDISDRRAAEKRQRTETHELASLMPMPAPRAMPLPLASAPATLRASTKIAPAAPSTIQKQVTHRIQTVVHDGWMRKTATYSGVKVLMVSWDADEPDLGRDVANLATLLTDSYNYDIETLALKSGVASRDVTAQVSDFVQRNSSAASLLILYYVGQSRPNPRVGELPIWTAYVCPRRVRTS